MTGLQLNLKLVEGPIHSLEKAKSKIPVNQNVGGIAAGAAFAGVLAESGSFFRAKYNTSLSKSHSTDLNIQLEAV